MRMTGGKWIYASERKIGSDKVDIEDCIERSVRLKVGIFDRDGPMLWMASPPAEADKQTAAMGPCASICLLCAMLLYLHCSSHIVDERSLRDRCQNAKKLAD